MVTNRFCLAGLLLMPICLALAAGCSTPGVEVDREALFARMPELNRAAFGEPAPVPEFEELVSLTPEQEKEFLKFYTAGVNRRFEPHRRIYAYLTRKLSDTDFEHRTLPAASTVETRTGNCMSLALVTTAFADLADVDVGWQLADTDPVYSSEGSVIYSANHIQTRLYKPSLQDKPYSFTVGQRYLLVDYYTDNLRETGKELSRPELIALVYQNLGVEAMADGNPGKSFWLLKKALEYDPANPNLYNALGVLHRSVGDGKTAEKLYLFALEEFGDRLIVLRNYRGLLLADSRVAQADRIEHRIMALPDPDPYPIMRMGDEAAETGSIASALGYYEKAADVAPYLHEVYLKIARIHADNGDVRRAERALRKARDRAWTASDQQRYQSKLMALGER